MINLAAFVVTWSLVLPGNVVAGSAAGPAADQAPPPGDTQVSASAQAPAEHEPVPPVTRRTWKALPANLWSATTGLWSRETIWPLATGAAISGAAAPFDKRVARAVADPNAQFGKVLQTAGDTLVTSVGVLGMHAIGLLGHSQRLQSMTYDMIEGTIVAGALTTGLKYAIGRERPDGSDNRSFPSGHASNAFVLATIAEMHYGWKVGVPAYLGAAAIAYSRMVRHKHYLSDCTAGAALGFIVGRTIVRQNNRPTGSTLPHTHTTWSVAPVFERRGAGLVMTLIVP